jgi:molecular chaperone HtpG
MSTAHNVENTIEHHAFSAETGKILQLVIHSLYSNRDIFLRELISNASDACDKLRYAALQNPELLEQDNILKISINSDEAAKTLTITDNGIGMNKAELIENLGTIARSGTQNFLEALSGDNKQDLQLIGQFGVGFYASFMVADEVTVISRKAGTNESFTWKSKADGAFTVSPADKEHPRGTSITLHLRADLAEEYTDKHRIRHIIETYADHIPFPVTLHEKEGEETTLNRGAALWTRAKSEINNEQYEEFYRHIAHAGDSPFLTLHNKAEGTLSYTSLLFIPSVAPFDLFHPDRKTRIRLYVKRVFITEDNIELLPRYLRFVRGIVDSEDLPLNISRDSLQHNAMMNRIKNALVKKILSELKKKSSEDSEGFANFWKIFGAAIKEGLCEANDTTRDALLEICRFQSSSHGHTSLSEYISRMKEGQNDIYYLTADSLEQALANPQLEGFSKRGLEVLLLTDHVDDFWVTVVHEHQEKKLSAITQSGISLDQFPITGEEKNNAEKPAESDATKLSTELQEQLCQFLKETLKEQIKDVVVSGKLADSPACLTTPKGGMNARLERFLLEQRQLKMAMPKILEINPNHPTIYYLATHENDAERQQWAELLLDYARIIDGEPPADLSAFTQRFNSLLKKAL